jgi:hypothetical protein
VCIHVGTVRDQRLQRLGPTRARRRHQDRLPFGQCGVDLGSSLHEPLDHVGAAVGRGQHQRRDAVAIGSVGVGAGTEQQVGNDHVVRSCSPMQRHRPIGLAGIHLLGLFQLRADAFLVASPDGVREQRCGATRR